MATQSMVLLDHAARLGQSRDSIIKQTTEHFSCYKVLCEKQRNIETDIQSSLQNLPTAIDILSLREGPSVQRSISSPKQFNRATTCMKSVSSQSSARNAALVSQSKAYVTCITETLGNALQNAESLSSDAQRFSECITTVLCRVTRLKDENDTTRGSITLEQRNVFTQQHIVGQQLASNHYTGEALAQPILLRATDRWDRNVKHQTLIEVVDLLPIEGELARIATSFSRWRMRRHNVMSAGYEQAGAHQRHLMQTQAEPLRQNSERLAKAAEDLRRGSQICDDISTDLSQMDSSARDLVDHVTHIAGIMIRSGICTPTPIRGLAMSGLDPD
ncbi:hypothetical protein CcaCcLH18_04814 [Colletotrichum camelliae]|nr:hypothetical protein CcaCcLH18_04814 [Colletotrichum camelliae]